MLHDELAPEIIAPENEAVEDDRDGAGSEMAECGGGGEAEVDGVDGFGDVIEG